MANYWTRDSANILSISILINTNNKIFKMFSNTSTMISSKQQKMVYKFKVLA